jgi:uncharacterized protein (TIRG00374 family)
VSRYLRALLTILLLGAVLYYVSPRELVKIVLGLDWIQVSLLLTLSVILIYVSCWKWRMFLRASGIDPKLSELFRLYVIGYFVNLFTPSTLGGDALRSYELGKKHGSHSGAFSATYFERFTGLLAMAAVSLCFLPSSNAQGFALPIIIFACGMVVLALASFSEAGFRVFDFATRGVLRIFQGTSLARFGETFLSRVEQGLSYARGNRHLFLQSFVASIVFHCFAVLNCKIAANAVGWADASIPELFVAVPLVLIISAIPLTPSGIGLQEGAFVFFLERIGASASEAAGVALLLRAKTLLLGVVGGVFLAFQRRGR